VSTVAATALPSSVMDRLPLDNPVALGGAACCLVTVALLTVTSLGAVPPLYYGIRYNYFNKYADVENVYSAGRHFIGPMNTFVIFPASVQNIEFTNEMKMKPSGRRYSALHTRTKEGLALHMHVSLQYALRGPEVGLLYAEFNQNYEEVFLSTIRDTLIKAAADFKATQLWKNRTGLGQEMKILVNRALNTTYANCFGLQVMDIKLPLTFDSSIVDTQVQSQNISTMQFSQQATQIRAETKVLKSDYDRNVTVILAKADANYSLVVKKAKANARSKVLATEAEVLKIVSQRLRLSGSDLVEYQQYSAIQMLENASVYFGFHEGTQMLLSNAGRGYAYNSRRLEHDFGVQASAQNAAESASGLTGPSWRHEDL